MKVGWLPAAIVGAGLVFAASADAAELKVLCSNGLRAVMIDLAPQFERATGSTSSPSPMGWRRRSSSRSTPVSRSMSWW